jgi:hypothetical protein
MYAPVGPTERALFHVLALYPAVPKVAAMSASRDYLIFEQTGGEEARRRIVYQTVDQRRTLR